MLGKGRCTTGYSGSLKGSVSDWSDSFSGEANGSGPVSLEALWWAIIFFSSSASG